MRAALTKIRQRLATINALGAHSARPRQPTCATKRTSRDPNLRRREQTVVIALPLLGTAERRSVFRLRVWLTGGKAAALTELEFVLRTARALVSTFPDKATIFATNALAQTVDPRLRNLIQPALAALRHNDTIAARKWLDRACEYERARRESIKRQTWSANTGNLGSP
jgi:hypothetical protein